MEVVALVPALDHVCTRYRILQFRRDFEDVGLSLKLEPLAPSFVGRLRQMTRRRQIVLLQRKLIPVWQFQLLRRSSQKIIYDFDDAVFLRDSFDRSDKDSQTRKVRFETIVRNSDIVVAGNDFLAAAANRIATPSRVMVVPTCVEAEAYPTAEHSERSVVRLVWIGSSSMLRAIGKATSLFESIGRAIPNIVLRVICDSFPSFQNLRVEKVAWSENSERKELANSDVGVSWLPDDDWSRGKCGLKVLQYMAAGLPVVASPVGVHPELVGATGLLANSEEDWITNIRQLANSVLLRQNLGADARARIERNFDARVWGTIFARKLRQAVTE